MKKTVSRDYVTVWWGVNNDLRYQQYIMSVISSSDPQSAHNRFCQEAIKIKYQRCRTTQLLKMKIPGKIKTIPEDRQTKGGVFT